MRTIAVHPEAAAALAPLAFGEFAATVWGDGGYLAGWHYTVPGCACLVTVWPENMLNGPDAPAEFTPAGPWSYAGRFDVATAEGRRSPGDWTNPANRDGHPTPHHALSEGLDEHRAMCFEFRQAITRCLECGDAKQEHGPDGSIFACEDFRPGREPGRRDWEMRREERGLYVPRD
ncbi:hypothetical protein [Kitasatospora sp. NPDC088548]|uniref:hypothetical protein n=1 Tax=Kitasatospora sp. NPDC088548 TaxID=3364075 RepID=UPI0037FD1E53